LFNPQRKNPKLQSNWEGPYKFVKKLSDVTIRIQRSARHRLKVVIHANRLAPFEKRKKVDSLLKRETKKKKWIK